MKESEKKVREYLARIGARGGQASRRELTRQHAKKMVAIREAKRAALKAGKPQVGTWLSLASPMAARFMARTGFDWLTVDIEHSPVNWESAAQMFGAIADAGCVPLARVPSITHENAKRVLDAGGYGIVFPMCCTREEAELAVAPQ